MAETIYFLKKIKRTLKLDEKIRDILLEMSKEYSKKKAAAICQKINFSIVLDNNIFKKSNVKYYEKLFDVLYIYLTNDDKDNSLPYKEIFYKYLLLDYILESSEIKHKKYMEILSYFLIREDKNKKKEINSMNKSFINYFIEIKKPKKIYHYLKFIYLNINLIKPFYEGNEKFLHYISNNSTYNNPDINKYKDYKDYDGYNQILCFLLNELFQKKDPKKVDTLSSLNNIKNPDYKFIKCLFIQHFSIDNKIKLKFIKHSKRNENEMIILKHLLGQKLNLLSNANIFDYNTFLNKLNILLNYYFDIYEIYTLNKNININKEKLLKDSIKLILDFFEEISERKEMKNIVTNKNLSADNINKKKEKNNPVDKNKNKETSLIKFINELFCSSSVKLLFTLYFNLYLENEFKDTKFTKYIAISIDKIYNPFYFYLLLPSTNLNADITINNSYKEKILEIIIDEIISINKNIKNRIDTNNIFAQNSIILLIRIYQMNIDNSMNVELEKTIISYLKYILVNWYGYSKYIFDINLLDNNIINNKNEEDNLNKSNNSIKEKKRKESKLSYISNNKNEKKIKENKFLLEIVLDIFFSFLVKSKNSDLINFFNDNLKIKENKSIFYVIDEFFIKELNDNMDHSYKYQMIRLLNSPQITTKYCNGVNLNNIIYSIYFLIYLVNKLSFFNAYFRINEVNESKQNEITNLLYKAVEVVFKDNLNLFKTYLKKIKKPKTRNKSNSNEILFKSYDFIFEYFSTKNKDDSLKLDEGKSIFEHLEKILQNLKKYDDSETKTYSNSNFSLSLSVRSQSNVNDFPVDFQRNETRKATFMPNENILKESYQKEMKLSVTNFLNYNKRLRSSSENNMEKYNNLDNEYNKEKILKNYEENDNKIDEEVGSRENSHDNPNLIIMDEEKETGVNSSHLSNQNDKNVDNESSSDSDSDNVLDFNSDYNCSKVDKNNDKDNFAIKNCNNEYLSKRSSTMANILSTENKPESQEKLINEEEINMKNFRKTTKFLPIYLEKSNDDESQNDNEHISLKNKLKNKDIPSSYYIKLIRNEDPKWLRIIFNPKRVIFKIFCLSFKKYIFNNKRFNKLKNSFKIKFKNVPLEKSIPEEENYTLKYPSKLKNFICSEYYKPFLKPMLNFFENEYFESAHSYIKNDVYLKDINEQDKFSLINYEKLILPIKDSSNSEIKLKTKCEHISNKGSIFGTINLFNSLMAFIDLSDKDKRKSEDMADIERLFFLFSSDETDRLVNKNKYIIIYYSEIKEMILRKYCFNEIAYEIFMKDGRSYFFNFFSKKNRDQFYNSFINKINETISRIKKEKHKEKSAPLKYKYDNNFPNIIFINEPRIDFEKNEISNFQYLLLVNKFSSRTYNDCNQYLVFPLLYMDINKKYERNLSKAICLNKKDLKEEDLIKFKNNFETMGYHFNSHYSTMAYILYYLMRVIPFTFSQIKLQSGHFDAPSRMFTSLENLLFVFQVSDENRELIPEFFYSYESFLNLNYNNFGYIKTNKKQINHFCTNQNIGIVEFIIDLRKILEKKELSGWINNIFGSNQLSDNIESYNKFPDYSYEQYNSLISEKEILISEIDEEKKNKDFKKYLDEKVRDLRSRIQLLSLGSTPSQLFKHDHPSKEKNTKKINISLYENENENNNKTKKRKLLIKKKSLTYWVNKKLIDFINKTTFNDLLFVFDNNDNDVLKIVFVFKNKITIYNVISSDNNKDLQCKNIDLDDELKIVKIQPYRNTLIELYENVFLICRFVNKTIIFNWGTQNIYLEWTNIVSALELYSNDELNTNNNSILHINKVLVGDEEGNLSLIEIETEYNEKKKEVHIHSLNFIHKKYKIFYSYINGILYDKRLNIIITSSKEGIISINNGFSFENLNIIEIENSPNILEFKLSNYNLLYIYTQKKELDNNKYRMFCYTLNGIKVSNSDFENEFINYFVSNNLKGITKEGNILEYNCATLKFGNSTFIEDNNNNKEIIYCMDSPKLGNIFIIFNKDIKLIQTNNEL